MKRVYTASHLADAHIVANLLWREGIALHIFNANSMGALGEIPADAAAPQVWLENDGDEARARRVISEYQARPVGGAAHACADCGEMSPPAFELCWNCGAQLP